jgi:hypothetical protein
MAPGGIVIGRLSFKPIMTAATAAIDDAIDVMETSPLGAVVLLSDYDSWRLQRY